MDLDYAIMDKVVPHRIKKFELISKYVNDWAHKILGWSKSQGLVYVDCMSNCGIYKDESEGTVVEGTAVRVVRILSAIMQDHKYQGKKVEIYFNDLSYKKIRFLENYLKEYVKPKNVVIHFSQMDASEFLKSFELAKYPNHNTLLVYDPYQANIDWDAISPFLNTWGEVIINHMVFDTVRGVPQVKREAKVRKYQNTYQLDIEELLSIGSDSSRLNENVVGIIKRQTQNSNRKHYVASFSICNSKNGCVYYLIHCCSNVEGLKLYKKLAWQTFGGKSSSKCVSTDGNQLDLFAGVEDGEDKDRNCFFINDVGDAIYQKFHSKGEVPLGEIYNWLDYHPVFPSDGFKDEIKKYLRERYLVTTKRDSIIFGGID